jgi:hypothetical protein
MAGNSEIRIAHLRTDLIEEQRVIVRTVNLNVTVRTLIERGRSFARVVRQHVEERLLGMALETQVTGALVGQHMPVDRPVGNVASDAPLHRDHFVLVEPRPAVLRVTLETNLLLESAEHRAPAASVGIVTVLTLDAALGYRVPIRK